MTHPDSARLVKNWPGLLALTTVIAVASMVFAYTFRAPQQVVFNNIPFALLICITISASAVGLMTVVVPLVSGMPAMLQWAVFLPIFALAGVVGTVLAAGIVDLLGLAPAMQVFAQNIRGTIPTSIVFGSVITAFEQGKARLRAVEAQLDAQRFERERAERLASEAQLESLTARVQPHFLFNTLNSIAALIREEPRRAELLVEQLSAVLRSSLDTATIVPLERELTLVRQYLEIQQARFGERVQFDIVWDAGLASVGVPPFAIQTLVENAVKHAGGQRERGVVIQVRGVAAGQHVVIEVTDDGDGFTPGQLTAGHGLDNLLSRLRALYGDRAGLEFESRPGAMAVRLRIPLLSPV